MARDLRIEYPGAFHHVMNRGYHQMQIFYDDQDFERFINDLEKVFDSHTLVIHAYCLMHNHFHLFTETPQANLQHAMHRLQSRYASYFKTKYEHKGKVFEKRYKAILVDTDCYSLDLVRYIHRNPLDVIVSDAASWNYSSYRSYLGYSEAPKFLDTQLILSKLDQDDKLAKSKLKQHMDFEGSSSWLPNDFVTGNSIMGSPDFIERIKDKIPDELNNEISGLISLHKDDKVTLIKTFISQLGFDIAMQLNLLFYALQRKTALTCSEINKLLGTNLKKSAISQRVIRVEELSRSDYQIASALIKINAL